MGFDLSLVREGAFGRVFCRVSRERMVLRISIRRRELVDGQQYEMIYWINHGRQRTALPITANGPLARKISVRVEDIKEIGVETTDTGPFVEDVFWLINRETDGLRIPQGSPVFEALMDYFGSLQGFDWKPFTEAMGCTNCRYFLCWRRPQEFA